MVKFKSLGTLASFFSTDRKDEISAEVRYKDVHLKDSKGASYVIAVQHRATIDEKTNISVKTAINNVRALQLPLNIICFVARQRIRRSRGLHTNVEPFYARKQSLISEGFSRDVDGTMATVSNTGSFRKRRTLRTSKNETLLSHAAGSLGSGKAYQNTARTIVMEKILITFYILIKIKKLTMSEDRKEIKTCSQKKTI